MKPERQTIKNLTAIFAVSASLLSGCSVASTIQPAMSSNSSFEGAVYPGESVTINRNPGLEEFRIFHQGATGFISVQTIRESAQRRAFEYCDQSGKSLKTLQETTSKPPHILGNFPRIEIIFGCVERKSNEIQSFTEEQKYKNISNLKSLLDTGAISKEEYDAEKFKILNQQ